MTGGCILTAAKQQQYTRAALMADGGVASSLQYSLLATLLLVGGCHYLMLTMPAAAVHGHADDSSR